MIGDPSGRSAERNLLDRETLAANAASIGRQLARFLDFDPGPCQARMVNNADWLESMGLIGFLRDVGKHFSIPYMLGKDSVQNRLERGLSYTEFSYMLLQAYDFQHLYEKMGVTIQAAGSDQWGNIVAGIDLVRKVHHVELFGFTAPLITKADGSKFGKTESGAVWLTADRTSPYAFYQFWLGAHDAEIPKYLKTFTLMPREEIEGLLAAHEREPGARAAHRALAAHVTELVHGRAAREQAEAATAALFSGEVAGLPESVLDEVFASAPAAELSRGELGADGLPMVELLVRASVAKSKREARELLGSGAVSVNGVKADADAVLREGALLHGRVALVRRGKKSWHVVRFV
jgi:tyrosyl-tRNA synthetase